MRTITITHNITNFTLIRVSSTCQRGTCWHREQLPVGQIWHYQRSMLYSRIVFFANLSVCTNNCGSFKSGPSSVALLTVRFIEINPIFIQTAGLLHKKGRRDLEISAVNWEWFSFTYSDLNLTYQHRTGPGSCTKSGPCTRISRHFPRITRSRSAIPYSQRAWPLNASLTGLGGVDNTSTKAIVIEGKEYCSTIRAEIYKLFYWFEQSKIVARGTWRLCIITPASD